MLSVPDFPGRPAACRGATPACQHAIFLMKIACLHAILPMKIACLRAKPLKTMIGIPS
jgi:hypothetical protein